MTCLVATHDDDDCYVRHLDEASRHRRPGDGYYAYFSGPILSEHDWMFAQGFRVPREQGGGPAFYYTGCLPTDADGPYAVFSCAGERLTDDLPSAAEARLAIAEFACAVAEDPLLRTRFRRLSPWVGRVPERSRPLTVIPGGKT